MEVTCKRSYEQIKIYIDGKLHLQIKIADLVGFHAWIDGEAEHFIEYYFTTRNKITTRYGPRDLWERVLDVLDQWLA